MLKVRTPLLLLLFLLLLTAQAWAAPVNVNASQASKLVGEKANLLLLDVRTPQEYFQMRLEGAVLIPIDQFERRLREVPRDRPVLIYCAVGSRSSMVANYLARLGYPEVYNLKGGIYAWQMRRYPVLTGPG